MRKVFSLFLFYLLLCLLYSCKDKRTWVEKNYTKIERQVTMRDGVRLFTSIFIPNDNTEKHPFLITRTPYSCSPYGTDKMENIQDSFQLAYAKENYILVMQDVRGRYMSEGEFVEVRPFNSHKKNKDTDEASDAFDTIDWLVKNIDNNNGKAGIYGVSYPGFYAAQAALSNHPALKAVSPQAPVTDWFLGDDWHHNGAFFPMDAFTSYPTFGKPHPHPMMDYGKSPSKSTEDNYKFYLQTGAIKNLESMIADSIHFWHELFRHPDYDDYWKSHDARKGLHDIKPALLWVGGLFDAEDGWGAWNSYKAAELQSPQTNSKIVMGPWSHGQWKKNGSYLGNVLFGSNTSDWYQKNIELAFFNYYLKGKGNIDKITEATIFFTGENTWKQFPAWPPANIDYKPLYLLPNKNLSFEKPAITESKSVENTGFTQYTSDPSNPVPYASGIHNKRIKEYMTDDQRFAAERPDVLTFKTVVLDKDITLAGPVVADLVTAISTTDADFIVKLIDVFPDDFKYDTSSYTYPAGRQGATHNMGGYQMLVRAEIMRGKYRNSFENPEPFTPGSITNVKYTMPDVAHTFKKGHCIMIQVQSSWFPLADRNPQKFVNIYTASDSDFQKSVIRIYHDGLNQSKIVLPVLK